MVGILASAAAVILGGLLGALCGKRMSPEFCRGMDAVFGICAIGMGISSAMQIQNLTPVVLAIVLGSAFALLIHFDRIFQLLGRVLCRAVRELFPTRSSNSPEDGASRDRLLMTAIIIFSFSGTGIYGSLDAGMTGDPTILLTKAVLDLFTAAVFACSLGEVVTLISIPQLLVNLLLFLSAKFILPHTTPIMIADFKACGGFLLIANGFRVAEIKELPIADMVLSLALVLPLSHLWTSFVLPLL